MSRRTRIVSATAAFVLLACGKSTGNSEPASGSSGGTSSSAVGSEGGRGGSGSVEDASSTENISSGGCGGTSNADSTGGETMTSSLDATSSTGNDGGAFASGGASAMTAEEAGCIVAGAQSCPSTETAFACPRDDAVPDTCSECYEPGVNQQGHPVNQCLATLPDGGSCRTCCCEPSHSGCEEQPESSCAWLPETPRIFYCIQPYEEPVGCTLGGGISDLVDYYCCP
jgi:hypothetical protein